MALTIWVGKRGFEVGTASFLKAWFSTIYLRAESEDWGSKFPTIMQDFYGGSLRHGQAAEALRELELIRQEFSKFPPDQVVWDFEDRTAHPPWGTNISGHITSLANYFVTSDGKDLFEVLADALAEAVRAKQDVLIT